MVLAVITALSGRGRWTVCETPVWLIVTGHELTADERGTVRMRYRTTMKGSPIVYRLEKRSDNSLFVYDESRNVTSFADLIFGSPFGEDEEGEGSFELDKSCRLEILEAPRRIELKPGESYTLATCTKANGQRIRLLVSCE